MILSYINIIKHNLTTVFNLNLVLLGGLMCLCLVLLSAANTEENEKTRLCSADTLIFVRADWDAGAEGGEEGSLRLYAHQLTALRSLSSHWKQAFPNLCSWTAILITHNRHFILFSVVYVVGSVMFIVLPYLGRLLNHKGEVSCFRHHMIWVISHLSPMKQTIFCTF